MKMTIDVAKVNLNAIQVYYNDDMQDSYVGFDKEDNESIDFAIEIMKKYQKIENRYKKFKDIGHFEQMAWLDCMTDIEDVINGYNN